MEKEYIKKHFDEVLNRYGHQVIYARRDLDIRCECYNEISRESDIRCDKCLQTGYKISYERVRSRRRIVTVVETNVALRLTYETGIKTPKAYLYYFPSELAPKEADLILEVEEKENSNKAKVKEKYIISVAEGMRDVHGEISFYQTYSKYEEKGDYDDKAISGN